MPSQLRLDFGEPEEIPDSVSAAETPAKRRRIRKSVAVEKPIDTAPEPPVVASPSSDKSNGASMTPEKVDGLSSPATENRVSIISTPGGSKSPRSFLYARVNGKPVKDSFTETPEDLSESIEGNDSESKEARPLRVCEVTARIKSLLEGDSILCKVTVEGEISNLNRAGSGHVYFTLKDEQSTLKATIWAGSAKRIKAAFANGTKVVATGSISVYVPRGEYQLIITDLRPAGLGALYEAFEKLKAKLQQEGLFDPSRKVPLPFLPRGVGIVTSAKGAVVQDIFRVIRRRYPNMPLFLVPVKVQGDGAAAEIVAGIRRLDADPRVDVVIVGRGGGSLEDLWAFNEEPVARAIAAAVKPLISAVGHETDTTIADFVADRRAATPSQAGELAVPVKDDLVRRIFDLSQRLKRNLVHRCEVARQRLARAQACRFLAQPSLLVAERRNTLGNTTRDLETLYKDTIMKARHAYEIRFSRLLMLNPKVLLKRGYIMAMDSEGRVVTSVNGLKTDQRLSLHLRDGRVQTYVTQIESENEEPAT